VLIMPFLPEMLLVPGFADAATFAVNDTTDAVDSTPGRWDL